VIKTVQSQHKTGTSMLKALF